MLETKTIQLFNSYLPQTENWVYHLLSSAENCEIHIAARRYLENEFYHPEFYFVDNRITQLTQSETSSLHNRIRNKVNRTISSLANKLKGAPEKYFVQYASNNNIQIAHAHFADVGWAYRNIASKLNIPYIVSFYGWDYEKLPFIKPEYISRYKELFQKVSGIICEGEHGKSILENYGCPSDKIHVAKLGVDLSKIKFYERIKSPNQLNLIQVASFSEKKGQIYAIEAVASVIKNYPNINLTLIGNANEPILKDSLEHTVKQYHLEDKIKFLPQVAYSELHKILNTYDVFIHPSCYAANRDCEGGAPIVLLDAQSTGMPVISTTHCDIPQEVLHGKTGLLSPEKNIAELAENIIRFYLMGQEEYNKYALAARKHVETNFNIGKNAKILESIYQRILDDH